MTAHYLQLIVNLIMFVIGAIIFWNYGGSENVWDSSLYEHAQALLGILIMVIIAYVVAKPCKHSIKEHAEAGSKNQNKSIPDLETIP